MLVADDDVDDNDVDDNDVDDNDVDVSNDVDDVVENFFPGICISLQSQRLGKKYNWFHLKWKKMQVYPGTKKAKT